MIRSPGRLPPSSWVRIPRSPRLSTRSPSSAAGNPFFAEEIVRDLAERGVLEGTSGAYACRRNSEDVRVPASLQATIAARIDRLATTSKRTLNAAAVIGFRFEAGLLASLVDSVEVDELLQTELIDQVAFTPRSVFAFRHPLIRAVAYESQLRSDRARLHQSLADTIMGAGAADDNAALIAEHLDAAGDLAGAYGWHMRAGAFAGTGTSAPRERAGSGHVRSPTSFPPTNPTERPSGSCPERCCAPTPGEIGEVRSTRRSLSSTNCALAQVTTRHGPSAWRASSRHASSRTGS